MNESVRELDKPLVSVLMTSYNREKYIADAINSVIASTYTNLELIITDDGSTDATVMIAQSIADKDPRIKVFINENNLGDYPNRNCAASYAKGKYLKYVDADDLIYPWGLELMVNMMEQFPSAGFGLCSLPQDRNNIYPFVLEPEASYKYHYLGPGLFHKAPLSSIIRRDIFELSKGFSGKRMVGDFEMWNRLAQKYPVVLMPHGLVWYRIHNEQEMTSHKEYLMAYEEVKLEYLSSDDCPLSQSDIKKILRRQKNEIIKKITKQLMLFRFSQLSHLVKQLKVYK